MVEPPIWKILCSSKWVHLPQIEVKIKNLWNHQLVIRLVIRAKWPPTGESKGHFESPGHHIFEKNGPSNNQLFSQQQSFFSNHDDRGSRGHSTTHLGKFTNSARETSPKPNDLLGIFVGCVIRGHYMTPTQTMHCYKGNPLDLYCLIPPKWVPFNDPWWWRCLRTLGSTKTYPRQA